MDVIKPGPDRELPRGVVGGAEVSAATTAARGIFMSRIRVEPGARSRPHYHANCESAIYVLRGGLDVHFGDALEHDVTLEAGDMGYVPPHETHVLHNRSESEPAEYVVARNAAMEDSVEVPWAG